MKLQEMELENYRGFKKLKVSFHPELSVIIGANGSGKTTVLDAASIAVGSFLMGFDTTHSRGISKEDAMNISYDMGSTIDLQPQFPVIIRANGSINSEALAWERTLTSLGGKTTVIGAKELKELSIAYQERVRSGDKNLILPIVSYYGTGRLWAQKKEKKSKEIRQLNSRTLGYLDCLDAESNEKLMLNWFQNMTLKELQGKSTIPELEAVRKSIIKCYKLITGYIDVKVEFNLDTHGIDLVYKETVDESYRRSPMKELSDGYKNTLSMIADIAYRMAVLNPALLENVIEQTPGVILIDEIDLHLHPKWQQRILGDLKEIFPLVQFIVTTHAPAVIHSVDKKSLLIFNDEGDLCEPDLPTYGKDVNAIMREVMNVTERPKDVSEQFKLLYDLIEEGDLQGAEEILESLVKIVGNQDSEVVGARTTLELEYL